MSKYNIRTDKFSKKEIQNIEESLKEWNYDWIVDIIYVGEDKEENLDVTFILHEEDLGEFLSITFACGYDPHHLNNKNQMIDIEIKTLLKEFFISTDKLIGRKIIRSSKYTADIAEYLSQEIYELTLCNSQREPDYDGKDKKGKTYQIKINNSKRKTNQEIGNPKKYDFLILMITANSKLFNPNFQDSFIAVYKLECKKLHGHKYIAKEYINKLKPEYLINYQFDIKNYA